jgi:hypothetical protein
VGAAVPNCLLAFGFVCGEPTFRRLVRRHVVTAVARGRAYGVRALGGTVSVKLCRYCPSKLRSIE